MRFNIEVEKAEANSWSVTILDSSRQEICKRVIRRSGTSPQVFPQPPDSESNDIKSTEVHHKLCTTSKTADIFTVYNHILTKNVTGNEVKAFGRYLFATLIGDEAWNKILAAAQNQRIELALLWNDSEWELHRLPWEMMRSATETLAADPRVSLFRLVPHTQTQMQTISLEPKVLFVVGSEMNDPKVKPGTEYLGMLRRLEAQNLRLNTRILDRATTEQLEDELETFQPSVVHFICHGGLDHNGLPYLEMAPDKPTDPPKQLYASSILTILKRPHGLPQVVVLNACYTGNPPVPREAPPLAFELVKGGIPMVVGMGGRVADVACRLFTRRFYEALLNGESVSEATAHGRRAGMMHIGAHVDSIVDWAMPTLFLATNVSPKINVDTTWIKQAELTYKYVRKHCSINNPPLFCDRHEFIERYNKLLDTQTKAIGDRSAAEYTVLAVEVDAWDQTVREPRYGKTRLLEELAAQAVRDGHLPCLVTFYGSNVPPVKPMQLGKEILRAVKNVRGFFGLNQTVTYEFLKWEQSQSDSSVVLHPEIQEELNWGSSEGKIVRAALQLDLLALQDEARSKLNNPALRVVVLIDEVHRLDSAANIFVNDMIDSAGLGSDDDPVPVVFAFSGFSLNPAYNSTIQALRDFLEKGSRYVAHLTLGPFRRPKDEWLLFQQFLLSQSPPLIIPEEKEGDTDEFYDMLYDSIKGVPSQLTGIEIEWAIRAAKSVKVLVEANDDEVLRKHP
jgi:hypothetical protein